jgi:acetyl-CoA C-acetyltransferase
VSAADLGAVVVREALARGAVPPDAIDDVILGCVLQAGAGMNVARQAAHQGRRAGDGAGRDREPRVRLRPAGRGARHRGDARRLSQVVVAGGTESMSQAPYLLPQARWGCAWGIGQAVRHDARRGLELRDRRVPHGMTAERVSRRFGISRASQDAFAAESQARAARRCRRALFRDEIVQYRCPRRRGARRRSTPTSIRAPARRRRSSAV